MSRISRAIRKLGKKIVRRKARRRALRRMYAKGRKSKSINRPRVRTNGIMLTA